MATLEQVGTALVANALETHLQQAGALGDEGVAAQVGVGEAQVVAPRRPQPRQLLGPVPHASPNPLGLALPAPRRAGQPDSGFGKRPRQQPSHPSRRIVE